MGIPSRAIMSQFKTHITTIGDGHASANRGFAGFGSYKGNHHDQSIAAGYPYSGYGRAGLGGNGFGAFHGTDGAWAPSGPYSAYPGVNYGGHGRGASSGSAMGRMTYSR